MTASDKLENPEATIVLRTARGGASGHRKKLKLPRHVTSHHLETARHDAEILAERLQSEPERMEELLNAVLEDRRPDALKLIEDLDITEEALKTRGGGIFWLVVLVVLLYATDAY